MDKQKKKIMWTILVVALIQMPGLALTPGINQIRTTAFSNYSLGLVQTALALSSLAQPAAAFCAAFLINRRLATKKMVIIFGLCLLGVNGVLATLLNTEFWHLILLSIVLGIATGCFISNMFGLLFDNFEPAERQTIAGYQSAVINAGGIIMGLMGGMLARYMWYGGYLMLLIGFPVAAIAFLTVPNYKTPQADKGTTKASAKMNPRIYYYCAITFLFMMTYSVCGSNLSTHMANAGTGDSGTTGIAVAFLMGGGVVSGMYFGKLSDKAGDYALSIGFALVLAGYLLLSFIPGSLLFTFLSVFLVGMSLSIMLPRCIYMVSTLATDPSTSATATALITIASPSLGGFMSPLIITNLTTALFGESTVARYRFVAFIVAALAIAIAVLTKFNTAKKRTLIL